MKHLAASQSDLFVADLLKTSEHILYRMDLVRGGYDYISPIALEIFGVSLEFLHERGLEFLLNELFDPDEGLRFRKQIIDLCRKSPETREFWLIRSIRRRSAKAWKPS